MVVWMIFEGMEWAAREVVQIEMRVLLRTRMQKESFEDCRHARNLVLISQALDDLVRSRAPEAVS
ncbi:hypothetical protein XH80_34780 [Bradyrhizobium sp. CCBAU 45384]|nr:hypothetical protein [Bradyrhizobium sp. CCBAU 45384]